MVESPLLLPIGDSYALNYAATAFLLAIAAAGLAHLLAVTTPRPGVFFRWIVGLVTLAAVAMPFALEGSLAGKVSAATINLAIGIAIGSLLTAVLARAIVSHHRPALEPARAAASAADASGDDAGDDHRGDGDGGEPGHDHLGQDLALDRRHLLG